MVKLVVDDFDQITTLEYFLNQKAISYDIELEEVAKNVKCYGIRPPYLIVDGVPLDFNRSLKWLKGHDKNE